jgi:hypothetical protein
VEKNPVQVAPKWKKVQAHKKLQPSHLSAAAAEAETNSAVALLKNSNRVPWW